ncbi:MAG: hypothetical protein M3Y48_22475 [Actinomycetota bacterium]|nr:hypothetical protein [Actinomycetota bacterium]
MQDAHALQVLVTIGAAVLLLTWLARRLAVASPIVRAAGRRGGAGVRAVGERGAAAT